jgi:hypothetical protein
LKPTPSILAALLCFSGVAFAVEPNPVLVGNYQSLGVDPKQVTQLEQALRRALDSQPVTLVSLEETDRVRRGLALCGEDAACVASAGERAGARWVLGYGAGKVGKDVLVNVLWVDVVRGKTVGTASRRVSAAAMPTIAGALVEEALKDVVLLPEPTPPPPVPPPAPPPVALVPETPVNPPPAHVEVVSAPPRPMRNAAIGTGIMTALFTGSTIALGVKANENYQALSKAPINARGDLIRQQNGLNVGADVLLGLSIAAGATTVILIVLDQMGLRR